MKIKDYPHALEIITLLEDAGMDRDPLIRNAIILAKNYGDFSELQQILDENPHLIKQAKSRIHRAERAVEDNPFWYSIEDNVNAALDGILRFAKNVLDGSLVGLMPEMLRKILLIYGVPETGKTWLVILILRAIFAMKNRTFNVIIFDRKGDYVHLLRENPNLIILKPEDIRFNIWEEKEDWLEAAQVVADENAFSETGRPIFEDAYRKCLIRNKTLEPGNCNYPNYSEILREVHKSASKRKGYSITDVISRMDYRFGGYIMRGPMFNCKKGYPLDFWTGNDIVIRMKRMSVPQQRTFMVGLPYRIYRHNEKNNLTGKILRTLFVADEGGRLFDEGRDSLQWTSNEALKEVMQMGRDMGLGWIIGAQQPNKISSIVRQNARFKVTFQIESDSMEEAKKDFGLNDEQTDYIQHQLPQELVGVMKRPDFPRPFMFELDNSNPLAKNVSDIEIEQRMQHIISVLQTTVIGPDPLPPKTESKAEPDAQEIKRQQWIKKIRDVMHQDTRRFLETLTQEPYLTETRLKGRLGIKKADLPVYTKSLNFLKNNGFIEEIKFAPKTRTATFYVLTADAHDVLENTKAVRAKCPSRKRFQHSYFIEMIKEKLNQNGHKAKREYGNKAGRVDVFMENGGERIAIEVILTDFNYMKTTLTKCFEKMKMDMVIIAVGRDGREKAEREIKKTKYTGYLQDGRLKIESVRNLT